MIVAIPLLVVLIASFGAESQTYKGRAKTEYKPDVSMYGTLTGIKDGQGRPLSGDIQEGFYLVYHDGNGNERTIYAIGKQNSVPNASYSGYHEAISGAGFTTQDGLNVTSGFYFDKSGGKLLAIRTIWNHSNTTMYLSEVRNYFDTEVLRAPHAEIGRPKEVRPLTSGTGSAKKVGASPSGTGRQPNQEPVPKGNPNCEPCLPDCPLATPVLYLSRATVVCTNSENILNGKVHFASSADLEKKLNEYRREVGCEHLIAYTGIAARTGRSHYPDNSPGTQAKVKSSSGDGMSAIGQGLSETDVKRLLILPVGAPLVSKIEYRVILPRK